MSDDATHEARDSLLAELKEQFEATLHLHDQVQRLRRGCYGDVDPWLCQDCGGPHQLDCSIPSEVWNQIAKDVGLLCHFCIEQRLVAAGLECRVAEFYYSGDALSGRRYAEDTGTIQYLNARVERLEEALRELDEATGPALLVRWPLTGGLAPAWVRQVVRAALAADQGSGE